MNLVCPVNETYEEIRERQRSIPSGYQRENIESSTSTIDFSSSYAIESNFNLPPLPVWRVYTASKIYETQKPISIKLRRDGEFFFAENEQLCVIGTGESPDEAVNDLCIHIVHFYNHYNKLSDKDLTVEAKQLKNIYKNIFIKK
ncbi:MAG: hypothetical protein HYT97_06040 [Elusimicrobia bacterium]|nr:hypothetical protein [Elusimicrobiota bacterium]